MLTKVTAKNLDGVDSLEDLVIPLRLEDRYLFDQIEGTSPSMDIIQITNIDGLEPVKANVNTSSYGSIDGSGFTGSNVEDRNIVLTLALNPDWSNWTPFKLRNLIYTYFVPKTKVNLTFEFDDDFPPVEISGHVETCEPSIFNKEQEVQVSIICPDPYFKAVSYAIEMGTTEDAPINIINPGTVLGTGFNLVITKDSGDPPELFKIQVRDFADEHFWVEGSVDTSLKFELNTVPGNKYVRNEDTGTHELTSLLQGVQDGSTWPLLKPGVNAFHVENTTEGSVQNWTLTYYPRFGGL